MKKPLNFDLIILSKISFHRTRTRTHLVIEPDRTEPIKYRFFPISNLGCPALFSCAVCVIRHYLYHFAGSVSTTAYVKTYLRAGQTRLNSALVIHCHQDRADSLNIVDIARDFVCATESRANAFGTFL